MNAQPSRTQRFMASADFATRRGVSGRHRMVEVRYDDDAMTAVDEIITSTVHLERMADDAVWMEVNGLRVWLRVEKRRIVITCDPDDCTLVETEGATR